MRAHLPHPAAAVAAAAKADEKIRKESRERDEAKPLAARLAHQSIGRDDPTFFIELFSFGLDIQMKSKAMADLTCLVVDGRASLDIGPLTGRWSLSVRVISLVFRRSKRKR